MFCQVLLMACRKCDLTGKMASGHPPYGGRGPVSKTRLNKKVVIPARPESAPKYKTIPDAPACGELAGMTVWVVWVIIKSHIPRCCPAHLRWLLS